MNCKRLAGFVLLSISSVLGSSSEARAKDLITNGGFEQTTSGPGQFDYQTKATGWTSASSSYNFIFGSGTADTTGSPGQYGNIKLWGPGTGSANGLPASSPNGGNFVAADGAFNTGPIQQTISGLTVGDTYAVSFFWAGAQQSGFTGPTTEQWNVSLGSQSQSTAVVSNASHGFTGWMQQTLDFTATNSSEVLSFLAAGTPNGVPPFALLDGVSMNDVSSPSPGPSTVPEPATVSLMVVGLLGLSVAGHRRRRAKVNAV